jgi:hypothetical protein
LANAVQTFTLERDYRNYQRLTIAAGTLTKSLRAPLFAQTLQILSCLSRFLKSFSAALSPPVNMPEGKERGAAVETAILAPSLMSP